MKKITFLLTFVFLFFFSIQSYSQCSYDTNDNGTITDSNFVNLSVNFNTPLDVGSSWKACSTGTLDKISILSITADTVTIGIYSGGGNGGTLLGSATATSIAAVSINDRNLVFDLASEGISLTSGNTYSWAVISGNFDTRLTNASIHADGAAYSGTSISTVNEFLFKIEVAAANSSPTVSTTTVNSITTTSAILGGNVIADGGATVTERGIVYSTSDTTPTIAEGATKDTNGTGTGVFSETVSSLTAGTTYYINSYAINSEGISYGLVTSFTTSTPTVTLGLTGSPLAENGGVATITATLSAASSQTVTLTISATGTATGFGADYNLSSTTISINAGATTGTATITGVDDALDESNETVIVDITDVANGTESGTQQVTATITDDDDSVAPTVTTTTQDEVTTVSADLGGNVTADGGASVTDRGIVWGTTSNPTIANNKEDNNTGTGVFSETVTSLPSNTTIHVRAYATNSAGTSYGSNISFTTEQSGTSNFTTLGSNDSGGTGFKTNASNTNYVVSNIMANDANGMYVNDFTNGVSQTFTIKADGTNAESFSVDVLNVRSFSPQTFDKTSTVVFKDKTGATIQTMTLNADKSLGTNATSLFSFFDNGTTAPVNLVAKIIFTLVPNSAGENVSNWTPTDITISNVAAPSTSPTITFSDINKTYGDPNFDLAATSNSGGTITYSIEGVNTTGTTLSGINNKTVTLGNVGSLTIRVTQIANGSFSSGTKDITLTVLKADQTTTFEALAGKTFGDAPFALNATASSGLTVTYTSSNTAVATISGNTVTIVGVGSSNITASQTGNSSYNTSSSVIQSLTVSQANLTITGLIGNNKTYDGTAFASVNGTAALSGVIGVDDVILNGSPVYMFATPNIGTGITITTTGYTISGSDSENYTLTQPTLSADITGETLIVNDISVTDVTCNSVSDGSAMVIVSGGTAPYSYQWSTGVTTTANGLSGLESGNYSVTIVDVLNNTVVQGFTIGQGAPLEVTVTRSPTVYFGYPPASNTLIGVEEVLGGQGPYTFEWNTGETTQNIHVYPTETTTYSVTITDANGCNTTANIIVNVVDVRCTKHGHHGRKKFVKICHKGRKTICVPIQAVASHLQHGDTLGGCNSETNVVRITNLKVFPNPFRKNLYVNFKSDADATIDLIIYNHRRKQVFQTTLTVSKGRVNTRLNLSRLKRGHYYLKAFVNGKVQRTRHLVKY